MKSILVGIDAGIKCSGVVVIIDGKLSYGYNTNNVIHDEVVKLVYGLSSKKKLWANDVMVVYEDIRPYTSRFNLDTINTCKQIGIMDYRLSQLNVECNGITRSTVRNWVFNRYNELATERIEKEIIRLNKRKDDGELKKPSFHHVDDRIIAESMRRHYNVPPAKVGHSNIYGLSKHSWQALAALTAYLHPLPPKQKQNEETETIEQAH